MRKSIKWSAGQLQETPPDATRWSLRTLACAVAIPFDHPPHLASLRTAAPPHLIFKISKNPLFVDKVRNSIGLYLAPPEQARILRRPEELDSGPGSHSAAAADASRPAGAAQPTIPAMTTTMFAALDVATGEVIRRCWGGGKNSLRQPLPQFGKPAVARTLMAIGAPLALPCSRP
jgi:hypothetical protein